MAQTSHTDGYVIFRAWITRDGERVWAKDHGLKAWRIWVPKKKPETKH